MKIHLAALCLFPLLFSCAESSFHGDEASRAKNNSSNSDVSDATNPDGSNTSDNSDDSTTDGSSNNGSSSGGDDNSSNNGGGKDDSSYPPSEGLPDDPVDIIKLGVNFEDKKDYDNDYNDAVLCFSGQFSASSQKIVSRAAQNVEAKFMSNAQCMHKVQVRIFNANGVQTFEDSYSSRHQGSITLPFAKNDRLEVELIIEEEGFCSKGTFNMLQPEYAKVLLNQCNE